MNLGQINAYTIAEAIRNHRDYACEQCENSQFWDDYPAHVAEIVMTAIQTEP